MMLRQEPESSDDGAAERDPTAHADYLERLV